MPTTPLRRQSLVLQRSADCSGSTKYISNADIRQAIHATTNKSEQFNDYAQWLMFGRKSVSVENIRHEQREVIKYDQLVANMAILCNVQWMSHKLKAMQAKGLPVDAEVLKVLRLTGRATSTDLGTIGWTCARVRHRLTQASISLLNQWLRAILAKILRIPANAPFSAPARSPHLAQVPSGQTVQPRRPS